MIFRIILQKDIKDGKLNVYSNGEMVYQIKGVFAKVSVEWKYQAPPGGGDTHYSIMHGTNCDLVIKQGAMKNLFLLSILRILKGMHSKDFRVKLKEALSSYAI